MSAQPKIARNDARWFPDVREKLLAALTVYDLAAKPDFERLKGLSEQTEIEGVAVHTDSAIIEGGKWIAPATLYVTLRYDTQSDDPVALSDSYPATITFFVDDAHNVAVERVDVDVSSFYGESGPSEEGSEAGA